MSIILSDDSITDEIKSAIIKKCSVKPPKSQYNSDPLPIKCYRRRDDLGVSIPLGQWREFLDEFPKYPRGTHRPMRAECTKIMYTIETDPKGYRDQDRVTGDALEKLKRDHTVFIAASPGFGKTSCGNYLACELGLKTVVLSHISKVNEQWVNEFKVHSTAKVQYVTGNKGFDPTADVYIIGVLKISNMDPQEIADAGIGTVIFDEAHVATITAFSNSLLKICPKYVIGLSATPERSDGMQKLISMYFGPPRGYIFRQEVKDFVVYKHETNYRPTIRYNVVHGTAILDWTTIITSLAHNKERQQQIADIAIAHPEERIMILSDRIEECAGIYNCIVERFTEATGILYEDQGTAPESGPSVYLMNDSNKKDTIATIQGYQIVIAGRKRAGIGFDDPTRTMLILCTDCKDVRQNEGRIRTTNNIVYDLVDNYRTMESHWKQRRAWYEKRGASISIIPRTDPTDLPTNHGGATGQPVEQEVYTKRRLPKNDRR